ncbi:MAG: hypothetical protein Q8N65_01300 [bacterium]|nr:hypothetical protein [bacterium]
MTVVLTSLPCFSLFSFFSPLLFARDALKSNLEIDNHPPAPLSFSLGDLPFCC